MSLRTLYIYIYILHIMYIISNITYIYLCIYVLRLMLNKALKAIFTAAILRNKSKFEIFVLFKDILVLN